MLKLPNGDYVNAVHCGHCRHALPEEEMIQTEDSDGDDVDR